ncbi:MAG: YHS domain-containing protein [Bacteroidetes bacterium]|nr:YHS domain-containing protein [Bacteroidota bacterium]
MDGEKKACGPDCKKECCSKSEKATETSSIWNKYCPVRGEEIDADSPTVEYMGKTIGFCCPGCDKKFSENPEKYMKNLSEDGQKFEAKS